MRKAVRDHRLIFWATRRRDTTKEYIFGFFAVQKAPASREQGHAQACVKDHYQTNKPKQHSAAKRSVSAAGG
jgi:hypothetical protein